MQGIIFPQYSQQSTATTHCFPCAYTSYLWYHLSNVSQITSSEDEPWGLNPNCNPDPNPNPNRRNQPNPNRTSNRNQIKFLERKQRTE